MKKCWLGRGNPPISESYNHLLNVRHGPLKKSDLDFLEKLSIIKQYFKAVKCRDQTAKVKVYSCAW